MSLPSRRGPGGRRHRGLFFCTPAKRRRGASNPLPPRSELYAGAILFSVSSIPSAIDARTIWRNCAGSIVSAPHSISSFPSSVAASSRRRASSFSSWARCSRSFFRASRAVGLDLAIVLPSRWPLVPSAPILALRGHVGKCFVGQTLRFCAGVGEVSLAERPSVMRALGLRQGRRGPTIFTGQARQKSLPPSPLRGRCRGP